MSVSGTSSTPLVNITGLASGLDTDSIVKALMDVEKRPQIMLQNKQLQFEDRDAAFTSVTGKLNALATAARNVGNPLDWHPVKAESSDPNRVSVSATSASSTGSVSFTVLSLASFDSVVSVGQAPDADTTSVASGTITIGTSAGSTTVNVGGGTLNEVAEAINAQTTVGLKAAVIHSAPGEYKLQLTATNVAETVNTPMAQFSGLGGAWGQVTTASQAHLHVGAAGMGFDVYADSNTFIGLVPGVNVTVKQADPLTTVTVTSSPDTDAMITKVQKMVDAYNAAIDEIKKQTAYDPTTKVAQPLVGVSAVTQARNSLSTAMVGTSTTTPALVGIQTTADGHIDFDPSKFTAAFETNSAQVIALFTNPADPLNPGLADRLKSTLLGLTQTGSGSLWSAQKGVASTIADLTKQIADYQIRLDQREADLRKRFAALESALSRIKGQGSGLSAALGSSQTAS